MHPSLSLGKLDCIRGSDDKGRAAFDIRYHKRNWHAKSWELLPTQPFTRPKAGPKKAFGGVLPSSLQCFLTLWIEKIQKTIVTVMPTGSTQLVGGKKEGLRRSPLSRWLSFKSGLASTSSCPLGLNRR